MSRHFHQCTCYTCELRRHRNRQRWTALVIALGMVALCWLLVGCTSAARPQQGGGSTATLGGAGAPTTVTSTAPENPQSPTSTTVEKTTTREYAPTSLQGSSAAERLAHNQEAAGSTPAPAPNPTAAAPALVRETVHEVAKTQTGAAQKDTSRDLTARLANMRGVMWVGIALLIGGPLIGWRLGWFTNGCIAGAVGLLLVILAQVVPGHEAWFGLGGLLLIPLVAFVYYRAHHDARSITTTPSPPSS